jgi:ferredoxin
VITCPGNGKIKLATPLSAAGCIFHLCDYLLASTKADIMPCTHTHACKRACPTKKVILVNILRPPPGNENLSAALMTE